MNAERSNGRTDSLLVNEFSTFCLEHLFPYLFFLTLFSFTKIGMQSMGFAESSFLFS